MNKQAHIKRYLDNTTLADKMTEIEAQIKMKPNDVQARWSLFFILCIQGNGQRALLQLQTLAKLDDSLTQQVQVLRSLIQCDHHREKLFLEATAAPALLGSKAPWMHTLFQALQLEQKGETDQADAKRLEALELAPTASGQIDGHAFEWFTDSDSRLGPVCELYHDQNYWWLSFADIQSLKFQRPQTVLDLIWAKVTCQLKDQTTLMAYMPMRYPLGNVTKEDKVLLSQYSHWEELSDTLVIGHGQKVFSTDQDDYSALDCHQIIFD